MSLEDKTEEPTDRRKEEARKKGQTAKSIELSSALAVLAGLATLKFMGPQFTERLKDLFITSLTQWPAKDFNSETASIIGLHAAKEGMMILLPILLFGMIAAALTTAAQVGLVFSAEPLQPQLNRLDPMKGMQRLCSKRGIFELVKTLFKVNIIGYVVWMTLKQESDTLLSLMNANWNTIAIGVGTITWKLVTRASLTILVIAAVDYAFQRKQNNQQLRMTKQELKEDMRRSEGDPTTKGRVRQIMREMARKRMMADVPKADVVVVNPIHFAIALKYDSTTMAAPKVIAKGQNLVAEKIKEIAVKNKVPIVTDIPLARSLHKSAEVGQEVPLELYQAVAEVLAAVYRMKEELTAA